LTGTVTSSKREISQGETISITITITNAGLNDIMVRIVDQLPPELEHVQGSITDNGVFAEESNTIFWNNQNIKAGEVRKLGFEARFSDEYTDSIFRRILNIVTISDGDQYLDCREEILFKPNNEGIEKSSYWHIVEKKYLNIINTDPSILFTPAVS
jgi:uncharacterized repeat protein (TIGR01451 family)